MHQRHKNYTRFYFFVFNTSNERVNYVWNSCCWFLEVVHNLKKVFNFETLDVFDRLITKDDRDNEKKNKKRLEQWVRVIKHLFENQRIEFFATFNNVQNRTKIFNHQLRVLANFSYLIHFLYDDHNQLIQNAFTQNDIDKKENLFLNNLKKILIFFFKYQCLLNILQNKKQREYQAHNKLIVINVFSFVIFIIKTICIFFWVHCFINFVTSWSLLFLLFIQVSINKF